MSTTCTTSVRAMDHGSDDACLACESEARYIVTVTPFPYPSYSCVLHLSTIVGNMVVNRVTSSETNPRSYDPTA
jgi:hypothetical protein